MFPITTMTFNNAIAREEDFTADQPPGRAPGSFGLTPVGLVTEDHALLDGMFVTSNRAGPKGQNWPTVLFVPPNGMTYEEMLVPACLFAEKYRADVLLFNYRGVGKSLGRLQSIEDAVVDTATFLAHACAHSASVGILGLSMGGGTAAAAVARLHRAGTLPEGAPSLFVAVHTFSSWFDVARGRFGPMWAHTFFGLARVLGMHDLETSAYLQNHPLAQRTLVAEASTDGVLPAAARLGNQPLPPEHAQVFWDAGARHGDLGFLAFDGARLSPPGAPSIRAQLHLWRVDVDAPPSGGRTASRL
jgi:hypothetical protein